MKQHNPKLWTATIAKSAQSRLAFSVAAAVLGCGTPLLFRPLNWRWYLGVNVPLTVFLIVWQRAVMRNVDRAPMQVQVPTGRPTTPEVVTRTVTGTPAKLPAEMVSEPPRRIRDLVAGESALTLFPALIVDRDRNCYLRGHAELRSEPSTLTIVVKRTADGAEVTLKADAQYEPQDLPEYELIPVTAIHLEPGEGH